MVSVHSCDHHDEAGLVPSNRSRARILEQFAAARAFSDAFVALMRNSPLEFDLWIDEDRRLASGAPVVAVDATLFLACWHAYLEWDNQRPRGDDLQPAPEKPPEIRVPPDEVFAGDDAPLEAGG